MIQQQPTQGFGQSTGGGLATSDIVKNLPKSTGGEGLTREELTAKRALEAAEKAKADGGSN